MVTSGLIYSSSNWVEVYMVKLIAHVDTSTIAIFNALQKLQGLPREGVMLFIYGFGHHTLLSHFKMDLVIISWLCWEMILVLSQFFLIIVTFAANLLSHHHFCFSWKDENIIFINAAKSAYPQIERMPSCQAMRTHFPL